MTTTVAAPSTMVSQPPPTPQAQGSLIKIWPGSDGDAGVLILSDSDSDDSDQD